VAVASINLMDVVVVVEQLYSLNIDRNSVSVVGLLVPNGHGIDIAIEVDSETLKGLIVLGLYVKVPMVGFFVSVAVAEKDFCLWPSEVYSIALKVKAVALGILSGNVNLSSIVLPE